MTPLFARDFPPLMKNCPFIFRSILMAFMLGAAAFYGLLQMNRIFVESRQAARWLLEERGDYKKLQYKLFLTARIAEEIGQHIPPGSRVKILEPAAWEKINLVELYYELYPIVPGDDWRYVINLQGRMPVPAGWAERQLPGGIQLIARLGADFLPPSGRGGSLYPIFRNILIFSLAAIVVAGIGGLFLAAAGAGRSILGTAGFLSAAYLTGTLLTGVSLWIHLTAGGGLTVRGVALSWGFAAGLVMIIFASLRKKRMSSVLPASGPGDVKTFSPGGVLADGLGWGVIFLLVLWAAVSPVDIWDEMANWILRIKASLFEQRLSFINPQANYYPVLWVVHVGGYMALAGGFYEEIAKWTAALFFLCFAAQMRTALPLLRIPCAAPWGMVGAFLLSVTSWIFIRALPENMVWAYLMAAGVLGLAWLQDRRGHRSFLGLAVMMAAGAAAAKWDGISVAVVMGAAFVITIGKRLKTSDWPVLLFFACALIPLGWVRWVVSQGHPVALYHVQGPFQIENIRQIFGILGYALSRPGNFFLFLAGAFFLFLKGRRGRLSEVEIFLLGVTAGLGVFSIFAGARWPVEHINPYYREVFTRLSLRAMPFLFLLWAGRIFKKDSTGGGV